MTFTDCSLATLDIVRNLGKRFREYCMRMGMTRKDVARDAAVGMTTLYKFESGNITDISFGTLMRLLRTIGLGANWDALLPELPESPYMYRADGKKKQRIRKQTGYQDTHGDSGSSFRDEYGRTVTGFDVTVNSKDHYVVTANIDGHRQRRFVRPDMAIYPELSVAGLPQPEKSRLAGILFPSECCQRGGE